MHEDDPRNTNNNAQPGEQLGTTQHTAQRRGSGRDANVLRNLTMRCVRDLSRPTQRTLDQRRTPTGRTRLRALPNRPPNGIDEGSFIGGGPSRQRRSRRPLSTRLIVQMQAAQRVHTRTRQPAQRQPAARPASGTQRLVSHGLGEDRGTREVGSRASQFGGQAIGLEASDRSGQLQGLAQQPGGLTQRNTRARRLA